MAKRIADKGRMADQLVEKIMAAGVPMDDFYIDPPGYPLSGKPQSIIATLDAIEQIMK